MAKHSPRVSKRKYDELNIDSLLESLFAVSDSDLIDASFNGLVESRSTDSHKNDFIQRALHVGSVILEAGKRSARKLSSVHNASVWPLSPDLTIKVFSMLDTQSLFNAGATCWLFQKCAIDPLCCTNIDLASFAPKIKPKIKVVHTINASVSTLIERAGNSLQSIKLGIRPPDDISDDEYDEYDDWCDEQTIFTGSCLRSLSVNGGAHGSNLIRLHLYDIEKIGTKKLLAALSVCPSLVDLKLVSMHVHISRILESVSRHCPLLEHFIHELDGSGPNLLETSVCKEFVLNCPKITTLALQACQIYDYEAFELVKGFHELKYVDFSNCYTLTGAFLENLATKGGGNNLEVMMLRGLHDLHKVDVKKFMKALRAGTCRLLRHLDISESGSHGEADIRYGVSFTDLTRKLSKQRPNFCLVNKS